MTNWAIMTLTFEDLSETVLSAIRSIPTKPLEANTVFLLGVTDVEHLLRSWNQLQRHLASAQLAIVRNEFSTRFPNYSAETEGFTFGIHDPNSDRYMNFLKHREKDDYRKLTMQMVEDVYPPPGFLKKGQPQGVSALSVKLCKILVAYGQHIEATLNPYYFAAGGTFHD